MKGKYEIEDINWSEWFEDDNCTLEVRTCFWYRIDKVESKNAEKPYFINYNYPFGINEIRESFTTLDDAKARCFKHWTEFLEQFLVPLNQEVE